MPVVCKKSKLIIFDGTMTVDLAKKTKYFTVKYNLQLKNDVQCQKARACLEFLMVSRVNGLTINASDYLILITVLAHFTMTVRVFASCLFYPSKYYYISLSASRTVLPMPSQLDRGVGNLDCGTHSIAALGQSGETANDCEESELDSIEKIKADLPKNIIKNIDDLTFIQPDVNSMLNFRFLLFNDHSKPCQ